jgi:protein ImuB
MLKRIVSLWFPRLASDRALRAQPGSGPFALSLRESNAERVYCLNRQAENLGLCRGIGLSDARALCPGLRTAPADPRADHRFLLMKARWAGRYCPWVGLEEPDGLVLNIAGAAHFFGGEAAMLDDMRHRLTRAGMSVRVGLADTRGAAWALAHTGGGIAASGRTLAAIGDRPVAGLRLEAETCAALDRLGLRCIRDLTQLPRAALARRFGPELLRRVDQALGDRAEEISPLSEPPHYAVRITLPEPIGLTSDVMAATARLLQRLCETLKAQEQGARVLRLTLRRVDQASQQVELRLARPMREAGRILPLFERGLGEVDAGFGIEQLRLEAVQVEALPVEQLGHARRRHSDRLDDLITRLGNRIGLENITRLLPGDSHIPERSFIIAPAAYSEPAPIRGVGVARPLMIFPPEPIAGAGREPPARFRWRRMALRVGRARGPERIAPEWWLDDPAWRSGIRDYWKVDTCEGRRLWLFHTPQNPGWFVQGEFA